MDQPTPKSQAIASCSTLEHWLCMNKPIHAAFSFTGWLETIRDIRHYVRFLRDHPSEEKEPNEPLQFQTQDRILDSPFS